MKKIAIISPGYLWFPSEPGMKRMYDLCVDFHNAGYEVDTYIPDFSHQEKESRDIKKLKGEGYPVNILSVHTTPYRRNLSPMRILSNNIFTRNLAYAIHPRILDYDAVIVSLPPNDVACRVVEICKKAGVPCILDIEDLWPEAMGTIIKNDALKKTLLAGFLKDVENAYENCTAVMGTSKDYTARAFKNQDRDIPSLTAHVGVRIGDFDRGVSEKSSGIDKPEDAFWVTYAGSLGVSYDLESLILAGEHITKKNYGNIRINIIGGGVRYRELNNLVENHGVTNVEFTGYMDYSKMAAFLSKSDIVVNSFIKGAVQSIVNKVGDYMAAGKPMINTLENPVFCEIVSDNDIGINVEPGNPLKLSDAIIELYKDRDRCLAMGKRARELCQREFDRSICNKKIIDFVEKIIQDSHVEK